METKIKKIMSDVFGVSEGEIPFGASTQTIRQWDSLKHIELVVSIEEQFGLPKFSMDEIVQMISLEEILKLLKNKGVE